MPASCHTFQTWWTVCLLMACAGVAALAEGSTFEVRPVSDEVAQDYALDRAFYKKCTIVQDILVATSGKVSDTTHQEVAYLFDRMMRDVKPEIAKRIRDQKVLCIVAAHDEQVSDIPQFRSDKTGKDLDFYNWRNRGFLNMKDHGRPVVFFAEEDVMEYEGGMQLESILIHEFGHVVAGVGFDPDLRERLKATYERAKAKGLWNDGYAAQKFRRVTSEMPVSLYDALVKAFPEQSPALINACLESGDILVNGRPTTAHAKVTKDDKVLIVFGGPKDCYHIRNQGEYWAEGFQTWYDTNRTTDHDHNHIHTRAQLRVYDPHFAELLEHVLGDPEWRFVSPRLRAGKDHLAAYDPANAPVVTAPVHIKEASQDYHDEQWSSYWKRLADKHGIPVFRVGPKENHE
jgi:hypothetical protein